MINLCGLFFNSLAVEGILYLFTDGKAGNTLEGEQLLVPKLTIKSGEEIETKPRFRSFIPGEKITFPKGT